MSILSYQSIMRIKPITDPQPQSVMEHDGKRFSRGCGPAGYDLGLDQVLRAPHGSAPGWTVNPGDFILASAMEHFEMPDFLLGKVCDKSSWARRGLAVQNTVIEPGWHGYLTLEMTNHGTDPLFLPRGAGICQVIFHVLDEPTAMPYSGKYQGQGPRPYKAV